jgi:hypothetical protein
MNGKGSKPRPRQIDYKEYEKNWQLIFGKKSEISEAIDLLIKHASDARWDVVTRAIGILHSDKTNENTRNNRKS